MLPEFRNEPITDYSIPENRKLMEEAIEKVENELGKEYRLLIGNEHVSTDSIETSVNPSNVDEVIGHVHRAGKDEALRAIEASVEAFKTWRYYEPAARARYLFAAAKKMRERKREFSAWMIKEVGKNWTEAEGDVAEAIDFMEYYGREMLRYDQDQVDVAYPGEDNSLSYIPLGSCVIIPPWNFPVAILVGMTTAAIVTGNTVVLKPASISTVVAAKFVELMEEVKLPPGVLNYIPGSGSEIGDLIVTHPKTRMIAFTGSKEVGLRINEHAARTSPGQIWIKRVIAEMGGKDTAIVDSDVDLDEAAEALVASAFGYQGQKCSACSRIIALEDIYDELLEKLTEKTMKLTVGDVKYFENYMGPVSSDDAFNSIINYIEIGKKEGRLVCGGKRVAGNGYYIEPTIIADVDPMARISQEEIFGPVVTVIKAADFTEALDIANNTEFGLTGGVFSRTREHLEHARRYFHVGNLYLNRKITGALVGVQPFGGFNMSGTDSKAGGKDYLLIFSQAKTVTERF